MSETTPVREPEQIERKKRRWPWLVLILVVLAVIALLLLRGGKEAPQGDVPAYAPNASVGSLPGKTEEEIQAELQQKVDDKMVAFTVNSTPVFEDGKSEGNLMLASPSSNINNIQFLITRDDTGEQIYDSGMLAPNSYIEKDKLDVELPGGEYVCTATILLLDREDFAEKGRVQAGLVINIKN